MTEPQVTVPADQVPRLKRLWSLGLSALEIGAEIGLTGDPSQIREAVLRAVEEAQKAPAPGARPKNRSRDRLERSNLPPRHRTPAVVEDDESDDPMFATDGFDGTPDEYDLAIPVEQRRSLLGPPHGQHPARGPRECGFPVGDPKQPEFFFCGAPSAPDRHYCAHHCRRAFAGFRRAA